MGAKKPQGHGPVIEVSNENSLVTVVKHNKKPMRIIPKKETYLVASFNDWAPCRMKSERTLNLETYGIDDNDIPEEFYILDDEIFMYGTMAPPGTHFFYMVEE